MTVTSIRLTTKRRQGVMQRTPADEPVDPPGPAWDTTVCPECNSLAEVQWRAVLESTDGPVEHAKILCAERHWFLLPVAGLADCPRALGVGGMRQILQNGSPGGDPMGT